MSKDVELLKEMREHFVEEMSVEIKRPLSNTNKINKFGEYARVLSNAIQRMKEQSMTEKLGVLLVDVPEPAYLKYTFLGYSKGTYSIFYTDDFDFFKDTAYRCTQEEAQKYPQFQWVALEELK